MKVSVQGKFIIQKVKKKRNLWHGLVFKLPVWRLVLLWQAAAADKHYKDNHIAE